MANNTNNIRTGVIDIPGALRPLGGADSSTNQVGGVVAYTGDIYDVTLDKNLAEVNSGFTEAIDDINDNISSIQDDISPFTESVNLQSLVEYDKIAVSEGINASQNNEVYINDKKLAMSFGYNNTISNDRKLSFGFGQQLNVPDNTFVIGQKNSYEPNAAFIVGNGTLNGSTNNAFVIGRDGNFWVYGINGYAGQLTGASQYNSVNHFITGLDTRLTALEGITSSSSSAPTYSAGTGIIISNNTINVDASQLNYDDLNGKPDLDPLIATHDDRGVVLSHANQGVYAIGDQSVAYGHSTNADGDYAIAGGSGTRAWGDKSVAFGTNTIAWGDNTIATGSGSIAVGTESVAFGENAYAKGKASGYFGKGKSVSASVIDSGVDVANNDPWYELVLELNSHSGYPDGRGYEEFRVLPGMYITEYGTDVNSEQPGWLIKNVEYIPLSLEWTCKVYIDDPNDDAPSDPQLLVVRGIVSEGYSYALGRYLFTTNQSEVAVGDYNVSHKSGGSAASGSGTIFSVGTGILSDNSEYLSESMADPENYLVSNQTFRANALEVLTDGSVYVRGVGGYDGRELTGKTDLATVITNINTALANVSGGGISHASGALSVTYGDGCIASGDQSFAGGTGSMAIGENSVALGDSASAFDSESFAGGTTERMHVRLVSESTEGAIHYITLTCVSYNTALCSEAMYLCDYTTLEPYIRSRAVTVSGSTIRLEVDDYNFTETELPSGKNLANTDFWLCAGGCGNSSFSYGDNLVTTNPGEAAFGRRNVSRTGNQEDGADDTLFSVGMGTIDRTNAIEILTGGSVYVNGIGDFDGTSIANVDSLQTVITDVNTRLSDLEAASSSSSSSPTYSAGTGISISNNTISVNTSSLNYNDLSNIPLLKTAENGFKIVAHGSNKYNTASSENAFAEGTHTKASGKSSHAEGNATTASGDYSHAEGNLTEASGERSHAEGNVGIAKGYASHAEGEGGVAYGKESHVEGLYTSLEPQITRAYTAGSDTIYVDTPISIGYLISSDDDISYIPVQSCQYQENEGDYKVVFAGLNENLEIDDSIYANPCAYGLASHTEGWRTHAYGKGSHAEGVYTETTNEAEHASGRYNKSTSNVTQFSVGVGGSNRRANAFEIDVNGGIYIQDIGNYDGTNIGQNGVKSVQQVITDLTLQIVALTNNL